MQLCRGMSLHVPAPISCSMPLHTLTRPSCPDLHSHPEVASCSGAGNPAACRCPALAPPSIPAQPSPPLHRPVPQVAVEVYLECPPIGLDQLRPVLAENYIGNTDKFQVPSGWWCAVVVSLSGKPLVEACRWRQSAAGVAPRAPASAAGPRARLPAGRARRDSATYLPCQQCSRRQRALQTACVHHPMPRSKS